MKSTLVLKQNIDGLLHQRHKTRRDLARYVRRTLDKKADSWISHIFGQKGYYSRDIPSRDLDRIADFFGCGVHQLFQPGFGGKTSGSERRAVQRRINPGRRATDRKTDLPTTSRLGIAITPELEAFLADVIAGPYEAFQYLRDYAAATRFAARSIEPDTSVREADAGTNGEATPVTLAAHRHVKTKRKPPK